jgi:ribulose-bisphosphate carboxylase large chain
VSEGVERANRETGRKCLYAPMIAGPANRVLDRALFAKQAGATALLVAPGLVGLDMMRVMADDDRIGLPVLSHPAFQGCYVTAPDNGVSHYALFGQINRLAGADAAIFPNFGGRFSFTLPECMSVVHGASVPMGNVKPAFALPAGGMTLERVPDMVKTYGGDVILLIGGGLYRGDLVDNCRRFRTLVEQV